LRAAQEPELVEAMRATQREMLYSGISGFCDFREEGLKGVLQLKAANEGLPVDTIIFGRPKGQSYDKAELDALLQQVDGIGISSISDYEYSELEKISNHTRSSGKGFALHASERVHEDLDRVLDLKPDFLIHMTKGTPADFEVLAAEDVPVILCPRSNKFFGNTPNISGMLEKKVTIGLGTDNVMLNPPDLFQEIRVAYEILSAQSTPQQLSEILKMGVVNFRKVLNHKYHIPHQRLEVGQEAKFILIEIQYNDLDPTQIVVTKIQNQNISVISIGNEFLWCRGRSKHKL
jgi:cytosine/adenosine deaminase-related metal-dependent hydrolase